MLTFGAKEKDGRRPSVKEVNNMFDLLVPRLNTGLRQMEDLFECALPASFSNVYEYGSWTPASDITESDRNYLVVMEVPGVDMSKLDISYDDGELIIRGEKSIEAAEGEAYLCNERYGGKFSRSFDIPKKIVADKIDATMKDGILRVTLPKSEESVTKKIIVH
jgi:HSP20 family protein